MFNVLLKVLLLKNELNPKGYRDDKKVCFQDDFVTAIVYFLNLKG